MLNKIGILNKKELKSILVSLEDIREEIDNNKFEITNEGLHYTIENRVIKETGIDCGGKFHTARSRNDQIITESRLYMRSELLKTMELILDFNKTLITLGETYIQTIMPGYTHIQHAVPQTLGFWALAYADSFLRNFDRLREDYTRVNMNPLGAGSSYAVSYPIDRILTTKLLGFNDIHENALDVVNSRGEMEIEILSDLSLIAVQLSRLAEDLILWSTYEFRMVDIDESYTMGSSIMPQKKNPDVCELIRSSSSTVFSHLLNCLCVLKGTPSGYNRDSRETKSAFIKGFDIIKSNLDMMKGMLDTLKVNEKRMYDLVTKNFCCAMDFAMMFTTLGLSFREAHIITGAIVKESIERSLVLEDVTPEMIAQASYKITGNTINVTENLIKEYANPEKALNRKKHIGSPAKAEMERMIIDRKKQIESKIKDLKTLEICIEKAETSLQTKVKIIIEN